MSSVLVEERRAPRPAASAVAEPAAGHGSLADVLARLPADAPADIASKCEALAHGYLEASSQSGKAKVLDGIRHLVQVEQDRQARIARNSVIIEKLYQELDGLSNDMVDTLRGVLKGLDRASALPAGLRNRVTAAKAAAEVAQTGSSSWRRPLRPSRNSAMPWGRISALLCPRRVRWWSFPTAPGTVCSPGTQPAASAQRRSLRSGRPQGFAGRQGCGGILLPGLRGAEGQDARGGRGPAHAAGGRPGADADPGPPGQVPAPVLRPAGTCSDRTGAFIMTEAHLPNWAREVVTLLPACAHFLLSGNTRDQYFVRNNPIDGDPAGRTVLWPLPRLLAEAFHSHGIETTVIYDITRGGRTIPEDPATTERAESILGGRMKDVAPARSLRGLGELISRVSEADEPIALILLSASRLVRDVTQLSEEEFEFYRHVDTTARRSQPAGRQDSDRSLFNPVAWVLDNERDVPRWFALRNEALRSIVLPLPDAGERRALAERLVPQLGSSGEPGLPEAAKVLAEQTAGMTLVALNRTVAIARDQGLGPERVEDAARSYRVGVTDNPWRASYLTTRLRAELAAMADDSAHGRHSFLKTRLVGQEVAVRKALDILIRSAAGLTAAQRRRPQPGRAASCSSRGRRGWARPNWPRH